MADDYLALGEKEKEKAILNDLANKSVEYITWYLSLDDQRLQRFIRGLSALFLYSG